MRRSRVCKSICIVLVSSLPVLRPFSNRRCSRFPTPSVFVAERFLARRFSTVLTPRCAGGFIWSPSYVLLSSSFARAQFVFLRSLPETAVSVISEFNAVALLGFDFRMRRARAPGHRWIFIRRPAKEVNTIAGNSGVRDYDDTDRFLCGLANIRNGNKYDWSIPKK